MPLHRLAPAEAEPNYGLRKLAITRVLLYLLAVVIAFSLQVSAQQSGTSQDQTPDAPSATKGVMAQTENLFVILNRKSLFFPNIAATDGPLTAKGKFKLFVSDSVAPSQFLASALGSALAQASDSPHGYGQGWDGYGKRFGSSMARAASTNFFGDFVLASTLHQDPRFFAEKNPTFFGAVKYSLKRVVVTRNDDGRPVFNSSGLGGVALAEGLANAYWPEADRGFGSTMGRIGTDLGSMAGGYLLRDYWPVFFKKLVPSSASK
jgi:hypothetical protein